MNRPLFASAILAATLASPLVALAADPAGNFAVRGIGSQLCSALNDQVAKKDPNLAATLESWVSGYVTSMNRLQPDTFDASPILQNGALAQMVVNVCQRTPKSAVETVTFDIFKALSPARVHAASTNVTATSDGKTIVLRRETLIALQTALTRQGVGKEAATGLFTPATATALKAFQAKAKLTQTGLPDPATTIALLAPGR